MRKILRNSQGSSLVESIVVLPILLVFGMGLSVSLLWGWARLEITILTQDLLVCEISERKIQECRQDYIQKVSKIPGGWKVLSLTTTGAEKKKVSARLKSQIGAYSYVFKVEEYNPWYHWKRRALGSPQWLRGNDLPAHDSAHGDSRGLGVLGFD